MKEIWEARVQSPMHVRTMTKSIVKGVNFLFQMYSIYRRSTKRQFRPTKMER